MSWLRLQPIWSYDCLIALMPAKAIWHPKACQDAKRHDSDIAVFFALIEAHWITCTHLHPCLWFSTLPVSAEHSQNKGDQIKFTTHSRELVVTHTHKLCWMMTEVRLLSLSVDAIWCNKMQHLFEAAWGANAQLLQLHRPNQLVGPLDMANVWGWSSLGWHDLSIFKQYSAKASHANARMPFYQHLCTPTHMCGHSMQTA